jgi:8-oxo-dGTP pyrophosphatase MutT (NUDIX family)
MARLPRRATRPRHGRSTAAHDRDALDALPPRRDGPPNQRRHGAVARLRNTTATSAGGIVVRFEEGVPYLVVGSRRRDRGVVTWTLPKGTPNAGESREQTAIREVGEETGLEVQITAPLDSIEYWFVQGGVRIHKTVHYFLMEAVGGDLSQHDHEFESVRWVSFEAAPDLLTFETERALVARAAGAIAEPSEGSSADPTERVAPAGQGA